MTNRKYFWIITLCAGSLLCVLPVSGQQRRPQSQPLPQSQPVPQSQQSSATYWSATQSASIGITPLNICLQNDSVTLHWKIEISDIRVQSNYSHVIIPILVGANNSLTLPRIIISGRKRASYDMRERALNPFQSRPYSILVYHRRRPVEPVYYSVSFPYSSWMDHCALELRQLSETTWRSVLLSNERLCNHLPIQEGIQHAVAVPAANLTPVVVATPATPSTIYKEQSTPEEQQTHRARTELFLSYPEGYSGVDALFSNNATELAKVDRLLLPLLGASHNGTLTILVTGYSSPEGVYMDNEQLSKKRAEAFARYLRAAYQLPPGCQIRTAWVAEDWQGLCERLKQLDIPYRNRALDIIDNVGIFEGRERQLMLLDNGSFYRYLKRNVFPKLRRIEISLSPDSSPAGRGEETDTRYDYIK